MKIAIIGYGKMGRMVEKIALSRGHSIHAKISSQQWDKEPWQEADICMEFTRPECVFDNIKRMAESKKQIIVGTTGWHDQLDNLRSIVNEYQIGLLYSSNFSIGVYLLLEILAQASKILNGFEEYDVAGVEYHHKEKKDSPSGTAIEIGKTIQKNIERVNTLPFSSVRCGFIPGIHTVHFDSPCDTISITHEARNREGFAKGAILAGEWLIGKKGLYSFSDCMQEIIQRRPT